MSKGTPPMPWPAKDVSRLRREFVELACQEGANRRALFRHYEISPRVGYKWIDRFLAEGQAGLEERSRRPAESPGRTVDDVEEQVVALRKLHPQWGGRKLHRRLLDLGYLPVPAPSTITDILHRHQLIDVQRSRPALQRFERTEPNALWQIDFKGHFETAGGRCHPLTLLDDHSRFNLLLAACKRQNTDHVQPLLTETFRRYGLPVQINADNGAPWGSSSQPEHGITQLTVWLIRVGIFVSHSRPAHPQTNGKDERFHRSMQAEVLNGRSYADLLHAQRAFDRWRVVYNQERPHEALNMATPMTRYRPSAREFPEALSPIEYGPNDIVAEVGWDGRVYFQGRKLKVSNALHRLPIAFRPAAAQDGLYDMYFCHQRFGQTNLRESSPKP
jgi:transposase InsO family protein